MKNKKSEITKLRAIQSEKSTFLRLVWFLSASVIILISIFGIIIGVSEFMESGTVTIGLALTEIEFPFPYFAKPITYLGVAVVAFIYSTLQIYRRKIESFSGTTRNFLVLSSFSLSFLFIYEVFYNFSVWNALITADAISGIVRIDELEIAYPNPGIPWNLVFATKLFSAVSAVSLYALYFFLHLPETSSDLDE